MTNGEKFKEVFKDTIADVGYDGLTNITKVSIFHNHYVLYFLKGWWNAEYKEPTTNSETLVSLDVYNQVAWERDIAIQQLRELGYEFGQKIESTKNDLRVDCIDRAEVLKLMKDNWHTHNGDWAMQESMDDIRELPSVTPQEPQTFKWCETCREYDQEKHCCHRWSKVIRNTVEEMQQEPKTGYWIKSRDCYGNNHFICSFCGHDIATKADIWDDNYCSNCGAKMEEVEE